MSTTAVHPLRFSQRRTGVAIAISFAFFADSYCAAAFGPAAVGAIVDRSGSFDLGFFTLAGFLVITVLSLVPLWRGHLPATPQTWKEQ